MRDGAGCMSKCWADAASADGVSDGGRAYALQQSDMYAALQDAAQEGYDRARRPGIKGEELDHSVVSIIIVPTHTHT